MRIIRLSFQPATIRILQIRSFFQTPLLNHLYFISPPYMYNILLLYDLDVYPVHVTYFQVVYSPFFILLLLYLPVRYSKSI